MFLSVHFVFLVLLILNYSFAFKSSCRVIRGNKIDITKRKLVKNVGVNPTTLCEMHSFPKSSNLASITSKYKYQQQFPVSVTFSNTLMLLNTAIYCLSLLKPNVNSKLMKSDMRIRKGELYRIFTSLFAHVDWYHLLANNHSLYNLEPVEKSLGAMRFLIIYLLSGILANGATFIANTSPNSLGASGSICGVLGAYATLRYRVGSDEGWLLLKQFAFSLLFDALVRERVSVSTHLFGFAGGVLLSTMIAALERIAPSRWFKPAGLYSSIR